MESQGKMMGRVFETLLSRHPDVIPEALRQLNCLSAIDYTQDLEALRAASSAYLNTKTFRIAGQDLCVGTSYNLKQKMSCMKRLFLLCNEKFNELQLIEENSGDTLLQTYPAVDGAEKRKPAARVRYRLFEEEYETTQSFMMYRAFEEILSRDPKLLEWAARNLHCASWTDFTLPENRGENMPSQFGSSRVLEIEGKRICIGSRYNLKAKQDLIDRLLQRAKMPSGVFRIHPPCPEFQLRYWQKEAIKAVINAMKNHIWDNGRLGIIAMPSGTGKSMLLAALFSEIFQGALKDFSILLLTSRSEMADQYTKVLSVLCKGFFPVEMAETKKALKERAAVPGNVLVSTAQKLLAGFSLANRPEEKETVQPYTDSQRLLVVVDEISYHYFSRTYSEMHARFPNAVFLGLTDNWTITSRLYEAFGPLLYQYTYGQAYQDGILRAVDYICINVEEDGLPGPEKRGAYYNKLEVMSKRMKQAGSDVFALLLCRDQRDAAEFYKVYETSFRHMELEVYINIPVKFAPRPIWQNLPADAGWDGKRFHGLLITCGSVTGGAQPFDLIFLDAPVKTSYHLFTIISPLLRPDLEQKERGLLLDFCNEPDTIGKLIPENFPLQLYQETAYSEVSHRENMASYYMELEKLSTELFQFHFLNAKEILSRLCRISPYDGKQLSEELAFLFNPALKPEKQIQYWGHHRGEVEWKTRLWCLLSKNSKFALKLGDEAEPDEPAALAEEDHGTAMETAFILPGSLPGRVSQEASQEAGAKLEAAVMQLLQSLFEMDAEGSADVLESLRRQRAGLQYGFDVSLSYRNRFGVTVNCRVECKNYQNRLIQLDHVAAKLAALQHTGKEVDHWILISPNSQVSNELSEMLDQWQESFRWEPIRDVQFWTPDENIQELFALVPDLYTQFFGHWEDSPPSEWSLEKRGQVLGHWKAKLAPVPMFPKTWREYLHDPVKMLTSAEANRNTIDRYEWLFKHYVPMHLMDERETPIEGTGESYFMQWLDNQNTDCALLLGDFGDGKTFFTYVLAQRLAKNFLESPATGWIPLRFSLSDLRDRLMDCRDFLKRRLHEFDGTIAEWTDIQVRYRFFIILDGLDEMSLGMNDTAVLENLARLEEVIEQFEGHKLLVTSRKMAIYADKVRQRILDCLHNPDILHLSPITYKSRLAFLEKLADTPLRKERLLKIKNTHDLLGLAAKPLFLEMMQVLLDSDNIKESDAAGIYQQYTENVLVRKFRMQLQMPNDYTHPAKIRLRVIHLLEELALCLQTKGTDSIGLDEFKQHIRRDNLVDLLWKITVTPEAAEDAESRITYRSLLKCENKDTNNVCFCHRSMKEYFVACGLIRRLCESPMEGKELLMECSFGYEILEFAGKAIVKLDNSLKRTLLQQLHNFAWETRGKETSPLRNQFERLGANSVNLIHYAGLPLQENDWSGLLLDNVVLSGMDLSGKDFSHSSMRYAHLDNADLTGCDLRGCDFTGVQFEKSGQLASFAVEPQEGSLLASYRDGKIRRWAIDDGNTHLLAETEQGYHRQMFLLSDGCEGVWQSGSLKFWRRSAQRLAMAGFVSLIDGARILDIGKINILVWQDGILYLQNLSTGTVLLKMEAPENLLVCFFTDYVFFVYRKGQGIEVFDLSRGEPTVSFLSEAPSVTALHVCRVTETEGVLILGFKDGSIQSCSVKQSSENGQWEMTADGELTGENESVLSIDMDEFGGIYASVPSGALNRYRKNESGELAFDKTYQLELKCSGAQIEGVHPKEQYDMLRQAIHTA